MQRIFKTILIFCLSSQTLFTSIQAANEGPPNATETVSDLVTLRLQEMKGVALFKWHNNLPIEDINREQVVLNNAITRGLQFGITAKSSANFFQTQIDAAKEIQAYWFTSWQRNPSDVPFEIANLNLTIRPKLIQLGSKIITTLAMQKNNNAQGMGRPINVNGLSDETASKLLTSIGDIKFYVNRLQQIIDSGILRVGTTGDYAPFSFRGGNGYRGIDIDLAKDLANSLNVKLELVETSWPSLIADYEAGKFDIGMSGISINLARQRSAFFSSPYQTGGKTPIIRCEDKRKYTSLKEIDQPATKIIVNPGGTNENFLLANIKNAQTIMHKDNRTIFLEIANHHADVMITDAIEVKLQASKHPSLCAAMPAQTFTFSQKGFLLPQDFIWKQYVDTWLNLRIGNKTLSKIFELHVH